jgi:hypothetical protein
VIIVGGWAASESVTEAVEPEPIFGQSTRDVTGYNGNITSPSPAMPRRAVRCTAILRAREVARSSTLPTSASGRPYSSREAEVGSPSKKADQRSIKQRDHAHSARAPSGALGRETGAAELLHNVKCNQIVAGLTLDDRILVIVNRRIGETSSRAYVI